MKLEKSDRVLPRVSLSGDVSVRIPGSKSLANRALILAGMARDRSEITNVPHSGDVRSMVCALRALGVPVTTVCETHRVTVQGCGGRWPIDEVAVDAGEAGTVLRFLTAAACIGEGRYWVDGAD